MVEKYIDIDGRKLYFTVVTNNFSNSLDYGKTFCYYYVKNKKIFYHRLDGPAICEYINDNLYTEVYMQHNLHHREDGPSFIRYYNNKLEQYYWRGENITNLYKLYPEILTDSKLRKILL